MKVFSRCKNATTADRTGQSPHRCRRMDEAPCAEEQAAHRRQDRANIGAAGLSVDHRESADRRDQAPRHHRVAKHDRGQERLRAG